MRIKNNDDVDAWMLIVVTKINDERSALFAR